MNPFIKTGFSLATLLCTLPALADQSPPPQQPSSQMAGYTVAAEERLNRSWDAYVTGNFIYWEASQDNMELGAVSPQTTASMTIDGRIINNNVEYKPGFQLGLGFGSNYDGWNTYLEYTWFHSQQHTHKSVNTEDNLVIHPMWLAPNNLKAHQASEKWKLELGSLDWVLGRTSLIGKKLTICPSFGLRAAWIDQRASVEYFSAATQQTSFYKGRSDSWGIGAKLGLSSRWLLGRGFKLYGDLDADLLYTRYTNLRSHEGKQSDGAPPTAQKRMHQHDLTAVRPHCDLELGFSWGSYFSNKACHAELSLGYGFQVFWNQNMFRQFVDDVAQAASISPNGDLSIQGLTASARFDF